MEHAIDYALRLGRHTQGRSAASSWLGTLRVWHGRHTQRRALSQLDDRLLDDVGLTWTQAQVEVRKPFWRA